jgi:hypothetical protein
VIADTWFDRHAKKRVYKTPRIYRERLLKRRDALRAANRCINGPKVGNVGSRGVVHGPVVKAGKCQRCVDVHDGGIS